MPSKSSKGSAPRLVGKFTPALSITPNHSNDYCSQDPTKRWERATFLRDVDCVDAQELLDLGSVKGPPTQAARLTSPTNQPIARAARYDLESPLNAGYEQAELTFKGGPTVEETLAAEQRVALEKRKKRGSFAGSLYAGSFKRATKVAPSAESDAPPS